MAIVSFVSDKCHIHIAAVISQTVQTQKSVEIAEQRQADQKNTIRRQLVRYLLLVCRYFMPKSGNHSSNFSELGLGLRLGLLHSPLQVDLQKRLEENKALEVHRLELNRE